MITAAAIREAVAGPATGPPVSMPRTALTVWETGLMSTKTRNQPGIVSAGTKTLLANESGSMISAPSPCTERGCFTTMASVVNTQHSANANAITSPIAARYSSGPAPERKPSSAPKSSMITPDVT